MDDNDVRAIEAQLEQIAASDRPALATKERQFMVLQALNALGSAIRELTVERAFGNPDTVHVARKFGINQRLELLGVRYARVIGYLEPETRQWFQDSEAIPAAEPGPGAAPMPGPSLAERSRRDTIGVNVSRLVPVQVRISKLQELALEEAKVQTGRTVSQLLRDALTVDRIQARRQWNRTDSDGQLTVKRWVRCDASTVRALQLVAFRERLTLSDVVRTLLCDATGV